VHATVRWASESAKAVLACSKLVAVSRNATAVEWHPRIISKLAVVSVLVARCARRGKAEERARLVTLGAVSSDRRVLAVEREARFPGVVEVFPVEGTEFRVDAGMLHVAAHAVVADVPVHALLGRDALRNGFVTCEAPPGCDLLPGLVALLAVGQPLEL
jgi:hypothetical protein